ncbi:MAG: response regulator [Polyangiaceae bacterium]|nr:response regulator [Polyangiaceae bacterium]
MAEILIVDDEPDLAEMLADLLMEQGHLVRIASNGDEGLRALAVRHPDLVLLDVEMPLLDGPGMAYQMLVRDCGLEEVPIVLLSGVVGLPSVAARVGTPYFLPKPYAPRDVVSLCDRALKEQRAPTPPRVAARR